MARAKAEKVEGNVDAPMGSRAANGGGASAINNTIFMAQTIICSLQCRPSSGQSASFLPTIYK